MVREGVSVSEQIATLQVKRIEPHPENQGATSDTPTIAAIQECLTFSSLNDCESVTREVIGRVGSEFLQLGNTYYRGID